MTAKEFKQQEHEATKSIRDMVQASKLTSKTIEELNKEILELTSELLINEAIGGNRGIENTKTLLAIAVFQKERLEKETRLNQLKTQITESNNTESNMPTIIKQTKKAKTRIEIFFEENPEYEAYRTANGNKIEIEGIGTFEITTNIAINKGQTLTIKSKDFQREHRIVLLSPTKAKIERTDSHRQTDYLKTYNVKAVK